MRYPAGCCIDEECEFDTDCGDLEYHELVKRITRYKKHVADAQKCFNDLVSEPAALVTRVAGLKSDLDGINATLAEDKPTTDLREVYAKAKVLRYHIKHVWNGFD